MKHGCAQAKSNDCVHSRNRLCNWRKIMMSLMNQETQRYSTINAVERKASPTCLKDFRLLTDLGEDSELRGGSLFATRRTFL